jgi:undecaprenyl diphosphate synthase
MKSVKNLPEHIAIIMDGNGRWAKKRNMPRVFGHKQGAKSVRAITTACAELGVKYLTLYAFSTENWKRPGSEVGFLMKLLYDYLDKEIETLMKNNVRLQTIGEIDRMDKALFKKITGVIELTSKNTGLTLVLALNYGSKRELVLAVKKIAALAADKKIKTGNIDEKMIGDNLFTAGMPDPDLLIRTSGEMRISNFLLWQIAYSEIYITDILWPDFGKKNLLAAIREYNSRERRYGGLKTK